MKWALVMCVAACSGGDVVEAPRVVAPRTARVQLPMPRIEIAARTPEPDDVQDKCPDVPDGFEDYDSCPDVVATNDMNEAPDVVTDDSDHDSVGDPPDVDDRCPDTPSPDEDDGCPDPG